MLHTLAASSPLRQKGPRYTPKRWFSWMVAAQAFDSWWHVNALVLMAMGIELGVYKKATDLPYWRPEQLPHPTANASEPTQQPQPAAAPGASSASSSKAASSTEGAPLC